MMMMAYYIGPGEIATPYYEAETKLKVDL